MALVKGTNSFVSLTEAEAYFADRMDIAAWTSAESSVKSQALVTATRLLDNLEWTGTAISESQSLAFPRTGWYYEPKQGMDIELPADTPTRVKYATYELAYHLLNNDGLLDDTGVVDNITVGSISLSIVSSPSTFPNVVRKYIKPLLKNSGSAFWWRAN